MVVKGPRSESEMEGDAMIHWMNRTDATRDLGSMGLEERQSPVIEVEKRRIGRRMIEVLLSQV